MTEQSLPEGEMATAIKALAESLGGVAVARPEWTDFEKQKERLGLAVIAVVASIQGHSDDWVHRDDLPKIIEQAHQEERERLGMVECPNPECDEGVVCVTGTERGPEGEPIPVPEQERCPECGGHGSVPAYLRSHLAAARQEVRERLRRELATATARQSIHTREAGQVLPIATIESVLDALDQQQEGSGDE